MSADGDSGGRLQSKYGALLVDPPWAFRNWSAKGTGRNAVSHYDCLDFRTLAMPIADTAETGTIRYVMIRLASR
jgi:N6-adenosine-specific RNA methylase IME4